MSTHYFKKYLKYKNKYNELKNVSGGNKPVHLPFKQYKPSDIPDKYKTVLAKDLNEKNIGMILRVPNNYAGRIEKVETGIDKIRVWFGSNSYMSLAYADLDFDTVCYLN